MTPNHSYFLSSLILMIYWVRTLQVLFLILLKAKGQNHLNYNKFCLLPGCQTHSVSQPRHQCVELWCIGDFYTLAQFVSMILNWWEAYSSFITLVKDVVFLASQSGTFKTHLSLFWQLLFLSTVCLYFMTAFFSLCFLPCH